MPTRLVRVLLLLGLVIGLRPAFAVPTALAQIDAEVRDRVLPAVVAIAVIVDVNEGGQTSTQWVPVGSGTVVAPDGLVLTNWHVVDMPAHRSELDRWEAEAADDGEELSFELIDDELLILQTEGIGEPAPAYRANVVSEQHSLDLAVLQITSDEDGVPVSSGELDLPYVPLGASHDVRQGDPVHVFGYPAIGGGTLQYTTGVVSGFGFDPAMDGAVWITTDASVSGGSSGGAAVTAAGELIGVPTQGGQLDCRPGDTNGDGDITADDVGCIPTGGSIGQLRPIDLAKPMLAGAGLTLEAIDAAHQQETIAVAVDPTATPAPTSTPAPSPSPAAASDAAAPMSNDVPMYRGNPQRTGEMPGPAPEGELGVLWEVDLGYGMYGQPALVDGVLYVAAGTEFEEDGIVAAFDAATGEELWRKVREATWSSPLVVDGRLYYTDLQGRMMALRVEDGVLRNMRTINDADGGCPTGSSPVPANDMIIAAFGCFGPEDTGETTDWSDLEGVLIAFDPDSLEERWRFPYDGFMSILSPAVADGIVFIADAQGDFLKGSMYAINAESGQELWRFSASGGFVSTPLVIGDIVVAVSSTGVVYALDVASGLERWRYQMGSPLGLAPASVDGRLYVGGTVSRLFILDFATGQKIDEWRGYSVFPPIAATSNALFIGGSCGYVYDVRIATGTSESARATTSCSNLAAPIIADGIVYAGTESGKLIALGDVRVNVPITEGLEVLIAEEPATIRAAPSSAAVVRGEAAVGTAAQVTGPSEEREGQTWWPVEVDGIGAGWVPESALIAAEVSPTPTPAATAVPIATSIPVSSEAAADSSCSEQDYPERLTYVVTSRATPLRVQPSEDAKVVRTLQRGTRLLVRTYNRETVDCEWVPVQVSGNTAGGYVPLDAIDAADADS